MNAPAELNASAGTPRLTVYQIVAVAAGGASLPSPASLTLGQFGFELTPGTP